MRGWCERNRINRAAMKATEDPEIVALMMQDSRFDDLFHPDGSFAFKVPSWWRRKTGLY